MAPLQLKTSLPWLLLVLVTLSSDVQGQTCGTPIKVGLSDSSIIPDDSIVVSSSAPDHGKEKIRLDCCNGAYGAAWCPSNSDQNPFVEIHLTKPVPITQIKIQPPVTLPNIAANFVYPANFLQSFDLFFKLRGMEKFLLVGEDIQALPNKTVSLATISLRPELITDVVRLEPKKFMNKACFRMELYQCHSDSMCPDNYCENGGVCSGMYTCDCSSTTLFGDKCQYKASEIPVETFFFVEIESQTIITSTGSKWTSHGQVTLDKSTSRPTLILGPGSYVSILSPDIEGCLKNLDLCRSGFTITITFSFDSTEGNAHFVLTSGDHETDVKGLSLFFQKGKIHCWLGTSTQMWIVEKTFSLIENKWYAMTVSWKVGQGLILLESNTVIGSSFRPANRATSPTKTQALIIGYKQRVNNSVMSVKSVTTIPLFIEEVQRAGIQAALPPATEQPTTSQAATTPFVPVCNTDLGMKDGTIKDHQITASSSLIGHGTENARADCCKGKEDGAWCADSADQFPWIQVELPEPKTISALSFQLPARISDTVIPANYVKTVRVDFRDVASNATGMDIYNENVPVTQNATVAYLIGLKPPVVTDKVRMYITGAHGRACMRFEIKGCEPEDLCRPDYCENNGKCVGENRCLCNDGFYGSHCELSKTEISPQEIKFKDIVNGVVTTTDPNTSLTASGNVSLIKNGQTDLIQLTNGGHITFPEDFCLKHLDKCQSGFTLSFEINVKILKDDQLLIATTGGHRPGSQGLALVYNKITHELKFTVTTNTRTWTVSTSFTWLENNWYKLTVTWSPAAGLKIVVNSALLGSTSGGQASPPANLPDNMCLGCGFVTTITKSTILVKVVSKVHVFITDLERAGLIAVTKPKTPTPTKDICQSTKLDFLFKNVTNTEVVTSLGKVTSYGNVSIKQEDKDIILVLDSQGEFLEISNTGFPCVDDITSCKTNLTYRMTFRFLDFHAEPNFLLSSGGDLLNSTGISLYYFHGDLNFWVKDGVMVWRSVYNIMLDLNRWYTIDASWNHMTGIELQLDGTILDSVINSTHPADPVSEHHSLHIAKSPSTTKDKTSLLEILMFRVWTSAIKELKELGCNDDLKVSNPIDQCKENMTEVKFKAIERGNDLVTSLGTMTAHGNVALEQNFFKQGSVVLVLDEEGDYVDMGKTGIICLDDVTACNTSFIFRITFMLTEILVTPNYIISSGGELNNATGMSLYYYNNKIYFWVKRGVMTDRKFFNQELNVNTWYTLDASWDSSTGNISLYIDGSENNGFKLPSTPTPATLDKYSVHLGKSPGKNGTTHMNILLFRFWEQTRTELVNAGCDKVLQVFNPPNPPGTTTLPKNQISVTFTEIKGNKLVTSHGNMTVHGTVTLENVPAGNILVIEEPKSYVEVGQTGVPCLDDITSCTTGFNFRLIFTLTTFTSDRQVIISSGAETDNGGGISLHYVNKQLIIYMKQLTYTWIGTFPSELIPGYWYIIDITWKVGGGLELHVNNILLTGTVKTKTNTQFSTTYSYTIGKSPNQTVTASMRVFEIDFWSQVYNKLTKQQLRLPLLPTYMITTPALPTTSVPATTVGVPGACKPEELNPADKFIFNLTFLKITDDKIIVTPDMALTVYGDPALGGAKDVQMTLDNKNDAVELSCIPCVNNLLNCDTGFTLQVHVIFKTEPHQRIYILDGIEDSTRDMGLQVFYQSGNFQALLQVSTKKWVISVPYKVMAGMTYRLQLSWHPLGSLVLYVNGFTVGEATKISLPFLNYRELRPVLVGKEQNGIQTTGLTVSDLFVWMAVRNILQEQGLVKELSTTIALPTTSPSEGTIEDHVWTLVGITNPVQESHGWQLVLEGGPKTEKEGVVLEKESQSLKIPGLQGSCLTNPDLCSNGFTIEINVKMTTLEENSIIFTSGGEKPDHPGVTMVYRYGFVHVIVSTTMQSWYVTFTRETILTGNFCKVDVSWSLKTSLKVLVNQDLVGVSSSPVDHSHAVNSITNSLVIGGGVTQCVVSEVHVWMVHIDILITIGIIVSPGSTSLPLTTDSAECPIGCIPSDACWENVWPTEPPCTSAPTPTQPTNVTEIPDTPTTNLQETSTTESPESTTTTTKAPSTSTPIPPVTSSTTVKEPATTAPPESTPTKAPSTSSPISPVTSSTTVKEPATTAPPESTPTKAPSTSTPIPPVTSSTTVKEPATTTTAPPESTPTKAPSTFTPIPPVTSSTTVKEPATTTTSSPATTSTTMDEPTTTKTPTTSTVVIATTPTTKAPTTTTTTPTTATPTTTIPTTTTTTPTTATPTTTTPTTTTTAPTTTIPTTTTTTPSTTTTSTTTTTTTTTTTKPPCPEPAQEVTLVPMVDINGQGQLSCFVPDIPQPGMAIKFTWIVDGRVIASKEIEAPDKGASLSITEMGIDLLDTKITCSAQARQLFEGGEICWTVSSNVVVPTFQCPPDSITVIEGQDPAQISINFTVPPALLCKPEHNGLCRVEVHMSIETGNELRCSRNEILPQAVIGISTIDTTNRPACGVQVSSENWQNGLVIPIKATVDGIKDRLRRKKLTITIKIIGLVSLEPSVHTCEVEVNMVDRPQSVCGSVNDPHMTTFDKVRYNNFIAGEFILYRHKTLLYEVRALYKPCNPARPNRQTCNCGAAVRSGDDVFTFNTCGVRQNEGNSRRRTSIINVDLYMNGDLTPGTFVRRLGCGQKYEVYLPSGTKVVISSSRRPFMNIHVHGGANDFEKSEGLCADFNGQGSNDLQGNPSSNADPFSRLWLREDTMFQGVATMSLPEPPVYCSCQSSQQATCAPGLDVYRCAGVTTNRNDVTAALVAQAKTPNLQLQRRVKRAIPNVFADEALTTFAPSMDSANARSICTDRLQNSSAVINCENNLEADSTDESIKSCIEDLEATGDEEWALSHIDNLIQECLANATQDDSAWNGTSDDGQPDLPNELLTNLCIEDCGTNGDCVRGVCVCNEGWTGETCDVGPDTIPEVLPAQDPCDMLRSSCAEVAIDGDNFLESSSLTCKFQYVKVSDTVEISSEQMVTSSAKFISMTKVICPEPFGANPAMPSPIGRSALVTLSNDGVNYSIGKHLHVVQKSTCQSCTIPTDSLDATCQYQSGTCVIDGQCYVRYERYEDNDCYRCDPDVSTTSWTKTSEPACIDVTRPTAEPITSSSSDDTIVIVLGVLCGVLGLIAVAVVISVYKIRRNRKKQGLLNEARQFDVTRSRVKPPTPAMDLTGSSRRAEAYYNPTSSEYIP